MNAVLRAAAIYFFLMLIFHLAGKRSLSEITAFDFVLLLIIGEATQQAILGEDYSLTNAFLVISTLIAINIALSLIKQRWRKVGKWLDGTPIIIVENGEPLKDRMDLARVSVSNVLEAARRLQGLERMEQIKYAVLESDGKISIIPK